MLNNPYLLSFVIAFMGCVFATPLVTRLAAWAGAIDEPDKFRRIHKEPIPRLGGLAVAVGLGLSVLPVVATGYLRAGGMNDLWSWWLRHWSVFVAAGIVLALGVLDDTRGVRPRLKLLGQALAVLVLYLGGVRIELVSLFGWEFDLSRPALDFALAGLPIHLSWPGLAMTMIWFLGCMNIWNLIDGMDGLASGVGILVSGTLMLVALDQQHFGSAILAAALAGSLAGFLLYNWHPACIFLGDSGSLLIGLLIGVVGVQDSLKSTTSVMILFPILAMGLPISDTAMAIFRRWVRHLPLSSADRRHVHHLLIGLGLSPRQAAALLYIFSAFLCSVVLLGVKLRSEGLALILAVSGTLAFLLVLTSRRNELTQLRDDFRARLFRGRQERFAAKATWEAIQRVELSESPERVWELMLETARSLGCDTLKLTCHRDGRTVLHRQDGSGSEPAESVSGPTATFRLPSGRDLLLTVALRQADASDFPADIAFRFLQRLALASAERLERLLDEPPVSALEVEPAMDKAELADREVAASPSGALAWFRTTFGGGRTPVAERAWVGDE